MTRKLFDPMHAPENVNVNGEPVGNTFGAYGRVVQPNAGDTVAALEGLDGFYDVTVYPAFGATVAVGDEDNFALYSDNGRTKISQLVVAPVANQPVNMGVRFNRLRVQGRLSINAIAAGTAGSIYKVLLTAIEVN